MNMPAAELCNSKIAATNEATSATTGNAFEIDVPSFLRQILTERFEYYPNPGNAGDALMAKATYGMFDLLEVDYGSFDQSSLRDVARMSGKTIVLASGGNFAEGGYNTYADILGRLHRVAKQIIVLPHTIHGNVNLLSQLGENVILICRERISYQHVRQHAPNAKVFLAHDMALMLDIAAALEFKPRYVSSVAMKALLRLMGSEKAQLYPTFKSYLSGLKTRTQASGQSSLGKKVANLYRSDIEKTAIAIPEDNLDASLAFNFGVTSPMKASFTVFHLLKFLDAFDVINTNRLHVAIAGALLGKQVNLSSNSYFKCQAVYDYSLKDAFPSVAWVGHT